MLVSLLFIAAVIVFGIEAWLSKSLLALGLALGFLAFAIEAFP